MRTQPVPHLRLVGKPNDFSGFDDPALVAALAQAPLRPEAAREVVRRYGPMVQRILRRSLGPQADVQDSTQEVFLRLFKRVDSLNDPQAFKQFIISITVHVLKWELKRRDVRKIIGFSSQLDHQAGPAADFTNPDAREAFRRFDRILESLSAHERTIFVLRFLEELSLEEVARATRVSLATVKRHLDKVWAKVTTKVAADPFLVHYLPETLRKEGET